mmetsp:Transcript_1231/g.4825  ORF Transcript_1231/g.4825 Transcript_1231/m.4825 type:complete len:369 (-) Transcript_1231:770-1876(-)
MSNSGHAAATALNPRYRANDTTGTCSVSKNGELYHGCPRNQVHASCRAGSMTWLASSSAARAATSTALAAQSCLHAIGDGVRPMGGATGNKGGAKSHDREGSVATGFFALPKTDALAAAGAGRNGVGGTQRLRLRKRSSRRRWAAPCRAGGRGRGDPPAGPELLSSPSLRELQTPVATGWPGRPDACGAPTVEARTCSMSRPAAGRLASRGRGARPATRRALAPGAQLPRTGLSGRPAERQTVPRAAAAVASYEKLDTSMTAAALVSPSAERSVSASTSSGSADASPAAPSVASTERTAATLAPAAAPGSRSGEASTRAGAPSLARAEGPVSARAIRPGSADSTAPRVRSTADDPNGRSCALSRDAGS